MTPTLASMMRLTFMVPTLAGFLDDCNHVRGPHGADLSLLDDLDHVRDQRDADLGLLDDLDHFLAGPESFRMESFRRCFSENIFTEIGISQNKNFQKESFRIDFLAKPKSFRIASFRRNLSETTF
jgi:hypothetical protein